MWSTLLPFTRVGQWGYIPGRDGRIAGLSSWPAVEVFARRPQDGEPATQIADHRIREVVSPSGVIVVIDCEHLCRLCAASRSLGQHDHLAVRGIFQRDAKSPSRGESLIWQPPHHEA